MIHGIYVVLEDKHEGSKRPAYFKTLQTALGWNVRLIHQHKISSFVKKVDDGHWQLVYEGDTFHIHHLSFSR